jgi:hypothetical protein
MGMGFEQRLTAHQHRHIDVSYIKSNSFGSATGSFGKRCAS